MTTKISDMHKENVTKRSVFFRAMPDNSDGFFEIQDADPQDPEYKKRLSKGIRRMRKSLADFLSEVAQTEIAPNANRLIVIREERRAKMLGVWVEIYDNED